MYQDNSYRCHLLMTDSVCFHVFVGCQDSCQCQRDASGLSVSCDNLDWDQVPPEIPREAKEVYLTNNKIMHLNSDDFKDCFNLTLLDLSLNWLRTIDLNAFEDLVNLKYLFMSGNALAYDYSSIPSGVFFPLKHLEAIRLDNNVLYYNVAFEDFQKITKELPLTLRELYMDLPCNESFASEFVRLVNLNELGLYRDSQCKSVIANNTFKVLGHSSITKLRIQYSNLTRVEPLAFSWFKELTSLDMSQTFGMSVADLHPAWIGLQRTKLAHLTLSSFQQRFIDSDPVILTATFFDGFDLPYLKTLRLDKTNIYGIRKWYRPSGVGNLSYLNLAFNNIGPDEMWQLTSVTRRLECLQHLDVGFQAKFNQPMINVE